MIKLISVILKKNGWLFPQNEYYIMSVIGLEVAVFM